MKHAFGSGGKRPQRIETGSGKGAARVREPRPTDVLRLITCGPADAKSRLISRLFHGAKRIFRAQESSLAQEARYRFFVTANRHFAIVETPHYGQFTAELAAAASAADVALVVVDANKGITAQVGRDSFICALMGVRHVAVAIDKIELNRFQRQRFEQIARDYAAAVKALGFASVMPIPISTRSGHNLIELHKNTPWYRGPTLLNYLESIDVHEANLARPFRLPLQTIDQSTRGYTGTVATGQVKLGDHVVEAKSGQSSQVAQVLHKGRPNRSASAGDTITLALADHLDIEPGGILVDPKSRPEVSDQFAAHVIWMTDEPLFAGRSYLARIGTATVPLSVTAIKYRLDLNTRQHIAATTLCRNEIAFCNLSTAVPVAFDPYDQNRITGLFSIADRFGHRTIGVGMITFSLRRGSNIHWQPLLISKAERAALNRQKPAIIWFTGLSAAGKSTVANLVEQRLHALGHRTSLLDGDNIRHGLNRDLGFTEADRVENIRRVGEVAKLMLESGLIVLCSFISPYRAERDLVRGLVHPGEFIEVFVDTPLHACIARDPKGLYAKARAGQLKNFTGIDAPYESPENPEVHLRTSGELPDQLADRVLWALSARQIVVPAQ
jgi:bifunctional enzyme CysN/CysC